MSLTDQRSTPTPGFEEAHQHALVRPWWCRDKGPGCVLVVVCADHCIPRYFLQPRRGRPCTGTLGVSCGFLIESRVHDGLKNRGPARGTNTQ